MSAIPACPKCGFSEPAGDECPRCGILFAKVRERTEPRPSASTGPPSSVGTSRPAEPRNRTINAAWLLLLLAGVIYGIHLELERRAEGKGPERVRTSASTATSTASPASTASSAPIPAPSSARPSRSRPEPWAAVPQPTDAPEVRPSNDYPKSWFEGSTGYEDATRYAREAGALVTLYVYTDWCPYCRRLEDDLLSDSTVQRCLDGSVKARLNPERSPTNQAVARSFGVTGYPSLYFVNPATGVATKIPTYIAAGDGRARLLTPRQFVTICRGILG